MTEFPDLGVKHTCDRNEYCHLNEYYTLWFCSICKKVYTVEVHGEAYPLTIKEEDYKKEDLSEKTRRELI